jgi:hypothetical protein
MYLLTPVFDSGIYSAVLELASAVGKAWHNKAKATGLILKVPPKSINSMTLDCTSNPVHQGFGNSFSSKLHPFITQVATLRNILAYTNECEYMLSFLIYLTPQNGSVIHSRLPLFFLINKL